MRSTVVDAVRPSIDQYPRRTAVELVAAVNGIFEEALDVREGAKALHSTEDNRSRRVGATTTGARGQRPKLEAYGGPLTEETAFSGAPLSRVGHLNDCFLASDDDVGTYQLPGEKAYAVADSAFAPVGGETCGSNPPRSQCGSALAQERVGVLVERCDVEPGQCPLVLR